MFGRLPSAAAATAFVALSILAGCSDARGGFPSLAVRAAERNAPPAEEPNPALPPAGVPDATVGARIAEALATTAAAERAFDQALPAAERAVAAAGAAGSDSWAAAQQSLSALEADRGPLSQATGTLDDLARTLAADPSPAGRAGLAAVTDAIARATAIGSRQSQAIDALQARLPSE